MSGHEQPAQVDVGILSVIAPELDAAFTVLGIDRLHDRTKEASGTIYWYGSTFSKIVNRHYSFVLGCIGRAGNPESGAAAAEMIAKFKPQIMILMGIAGGIRKRVKIGEVVLSERLVYYEPAEARLSNVGESELVLRPEIPSVTHSVSQDLVVFHPDEGELKNRFLAIGGKFPVPSSGNKKRETEYKRDVASTIKVKTTTLATGEKLFRDPKRLIALRERVHGKVEAVEMEAAGFEAACRRAHTDWLVIRGISDFGDKFKSDDFHTFASTAVAVALESFLQVGLHLVSSTNIPVITSVDDLSSHIEDMVRFAESRTVGTHKDRPRFPLHALMVGYEYELISRTQRDDLHKPFTPDEFIDPQQQRRILLQAPGGAGKSMPDRLRRKPLGNRPGAPESG